MPPDHWTHRDPDRHLWTPSELAQARQVPSRAVWDALYGGGGGRAAKTELPFSESEWIKALREGSINPSQREIEKALQTFIRKDSKAWSEHFPSYWSQAPLDSLPGRGLLAPEIVVQKMLPDFLSRARGDEHSPEASSALAWAMRFSENRELLGEALGQGAAFEEDDRYLFDKILPALLSSPEWEDFTVSGQNLHALIENIVQTPSVRQIWGSPEEHRADVLGTLRQGNPPLADRAENLLAGWSWPRHIGEEEGDVGYVRFIGMSEEPPYDADDIKRAALEASREGLSYLVLLEVCGAIACGKDSGNEFREEVLLSGGSPASALSGDEPLESVIGTGIFSAGEEAMLRDASNTHEGMSYDDGEDYLQDARERIFDGIRDASREYVRQFKSGSASLPLLLAEAISQRLTY